MIGATDRLSRCASALLALVNAERFAYEELDLLYAPSECVGLVRRAVERDALRVLETHGYTARAFEEELARRTCARFVSATEIGGSLLALLPDPPPRFDVDQDRHARIDPPDRLARCASALRTLAHNAHDAYRDGVCCETVRPRVEAEALEILAEHGYARHGLVDALRARAADEGDDVEPWYLSVLPRDDARDAGSDAHSSRCGERGPRSEPTEYVVTVGYWDETDAYELGTIVITSTSAEDARTRALAVLYDDRNRLDGCPPWATADRADELPAPQRSSRGYLVTVGYITDAGERHILGWREVSAPNAARARAIAIDELFDERLRAASCRAWARADRFGL